MNLGRLRQPRYRHYIPGAARVHKDAGAGPQDLSPRLLVTAVTPPESREPLPCLRGGPPTGALPAFLPPGRGPAFPRRRRRPPGRSGPPPATPTPAPPGPAPPPP